MGDKFWVHLTPGANTIVRKSSESAVTVPDLPSFAEMMEKTDAAVAAHAETSGLEKLSRNCGIPDRLLLPKGKEEGLVMVLMTTLIPSRLMSTMMVPMPTVVSTDRSF